ncbi:Phosphate-binding protein PstS 1 [Weissella viridescens]|jgi:phosphate transport system substrate-binding protein|uniref:phosphate ABC transporter substrate-binding protein n=1 Tax=Weissella viridescens TaxID=1629 RepID=UPI000BDA7EFE|nr:phosphate ABC transporter substrate-binding protein [Weissella viridescens]MBX4172826.1 phosphate ABC transporter substrate-binding protein [Weissella viridescens]QOD86422.1 phosphate ABC transporter substrate-binding protein [Weissella viridescens]SOB42370.1 Phosphate-binding protein PstS 1 [Weissella viridescens]
MKSTLIKTTLGVSVLAAATLLGGATVANADSKVMAVGSTALQPLAQEAGEKFGEKNSGVSVNVQGGGSGAGLSQVGKGSIDVGNSDIFASQKKGVDASKLQDHQVAAVGIAPVVNKDVSVKNLSSKQLKEIFTGKITNWKEVGGKDEKIVLVNRAQGSGTRFTFEQNVLDGKSAKTSQEQDDNGAVQKIVGQTPGAISYLAFSYTQGNAASKIKTISVDKVKPTDKNVADNKWKIWAYEHMYTTKNPSKDTKKYIDFVKSDDMKKTTKKLGYIPMSDMKVQKDDQNKVTKLDK